MGHPFQFFRAGGFDQVRFETGEDFVRLDELDFKLWVALACPIKGLAFEHRTLELIDTEKDGRIRAPELIAAVKWAAALLKDPNIFLKAPSELPLSAINDSTEEGKKLLHAAKTVLKDLGKPDATGITAVDTDAAVKAFHKLPFNGDNVLPPESAKTPEQKLLIQNVIDTIGGTDDLSGAKGVTADQVKQFFAAVDGYVAWLHQGENDRALTPLKDETIGAWDAREVVRAKIDDYFTRARLAAFDSRSLTGVNREEKDYVALGLKDLTHASEDLRSFPLARIEAGRALPLGEGVNPGWSESLTGFSNKTVTPLLGVQTVLTEAQWHELTSKLAAFEKWHTSKPTTPVEKLGLERLRALARPEQKTSLDALFTAEKEQEVIGTGVASVEKLVRYVRDLFQLANNFVSFRDFYEHSRKAIFQVGTLWLDQRECELCLRVEDMPKHMLMAPLSRAYLLYCDLTKPATGEKMTIVAAMTNGGSDNLIAGRNGLFKDREGKDWDATISKIVDNPISVGQAFWSPYKKAIRFVEEQVAKRAAEGEVKGTSVLTTGVTNVAGAATTAKPAAPAAAPASPIPVPKKLDIGVVAALGVAVGGITAAIGALLQGFFGLGVWMPVGVGGVLLLISGPSMIVAWLKLRERNIGPLLDANGWAVNAHAMLNVPFGKSLTLKGKLPPGSKLDLRDPYKEASRPWWLIIAVVVFVSLGIAWFIGKLDRVLPESVTSVKMLGTHAPAYDAGVPEVKDAG